MKKSKLFAVAILFIASACSSACSSADPISERNQKIRDNFQAYLNGVLGDSAPETKIDSVAVLSVDTLTEKMSIDKKMKWMESEYARLGEIEQTQKDKLDAGKGLNFEDYIISSYQRDLDETKAKMSAMKTEYSTLDSKKIKADNKEYKYHYIKVKVYLTEKGSAKNVELTLPATADFKVVEPKDL